MKVGHAHVVIIRNIPNCLLLMMLLKGLIKFLVSGCLCLFYVLNKILYCNEMILSFGM